MAHFTSGDTEMSVEAGVLLHAYALATMMFFHCQWCRVIFLNFVSLALIFVQLFGCYVTLPHFTKLLALLPSVSLLRYKSLNNSLYCLFSSPCLAFLPPLFSSSFTISVRGAPIFFPEIVTGRSPLSTTSFTSLSSPAARLPRPPATLFPVASSSFFLSDEGQASFFSLVSSTPSHDGFPSNDVSRRKDEMKRKKNPWLSSEDLLFHNLPSALGDRHTLNIDEETSREKFREESQGETQQNFKTDSSVSSSLPASSFYVNTSPAFFVPSFQSQPTTSTTAISPSPISSHPLREVFTSPPYSSELSSTGLAFPLPSISTTSTSIPSSSLQVLFSSVLSASDRTDAGLSHEKNVSPAKSVSSLDSAAEPGVHPHGDFSSVTPGSSILVDLPASSSRKSSSFKERTADNGENTKQIPGDDSALVGPRYTPLTGSVEETSSVSPRLPVSRLLSSHSLVIPEKSQRDALLIHKRDGLKENLNGHISTQISPGILVRGLLSSEKEDGRSLPHSYGGASREHVENLPGAGDQGQAGNAFDEDAEVRGLIGTSVNGGEAVRVTNEQKDTLLFSPSHGNKNKGVSNTRTSRNSDEKGRGLRSEDSAPRSEVFLKRSRGRIDHVDGDRTEGVESVHQEIKHIDVVSNSEKEKGLEEWSGTSSLSQEDDLSARVEASPFNQEEDGKTPHPAGVLATTQARSVDAKAALLKERGDVPAVESDVRTRSESASVLNSPQILPRLIGSHSVPNNSNVESGVEASQPRVLSDEAAGVTESSSSTQVDFSSTSPGDLIESLNKETSESSRTPGSAPVNSSSYSVEETASGAQQVEAEATVRGDLVRGGESGRGCAGSDVLGSCPGSREDGESERQGNTEQVVEPNEESVSKPGLVGSQEKEGVLLANPSSPAEERKGEEGEETPEETTDQEEKTSLSGENTQQGEGKKEETSDNGGSDGTGSDSPQEQEKNGKEQDNHLVQDEIQEGSDESSSNAQSPFSIVDGGGEGTSSRETDEEGKNGFHVMQRSATPGGGEGTFSVDTTTSSADEEVSLRDGHRGDTEQDEGNPTGKVKEEKARGESSEDDSVLFPPMKQVKKKRGFTRGGRYFGSSALSYFSSLFPTSGGSTPPHPLLISLLYSQPDSAHHALVKDGDSRLLNEEEEQVFLTVEGATEDAGDSFVRGKQADPTTGGTKSEGFQTDTDTSRGKTPPPWGLHFAETFEGQMMCFQWNVFNGAFSLALAYLCSPLYRHSAVFTNQQTPRGVYRSGGGHPQYGRSGSEESSFMNTYTNNHWGSNSLPFSSLTSALFWSASWLSRHIQSALRSLTVKWVHNYVPVPVLPSFLPLGSLSGVQHPTTSVSSDDFGESLGSPGDEVFSSAVFRSTATASPALSSPGFFSNSFRSSSSFTSCCGDMPNGGSPPQARLPPLDLSYGSVAGSRGAPDSYSLPRAMMAGPLFFQGPGMTGGRFQEDNGSSSIPLRSAWRLACMSAQALQSSSAVLQSFGCTYTSPASTTIGWLLATLSMASSFLHPMLSLFSNCVSAAYDVYALVW